MQSINLLKRNLRTRMKQRLAEVLTLERLEASQKASHLLIESPIWKQSKTILLFISTSYELSTEPLLLAAQNQSKIIALPRVNFSSSTLQPHLFLSQDSLVVNQWRIAEPSSAAPSLQVNQIDLILVPGLAFDHQGNRLGRGKGYYDQLLALRGSHTKAIGYFFACQEVKQIPIAKHDQPLDAIVTEQQVIICT